MVKLTQCGTVTIPRKMRDAFGIEVGDYLDIQVTENGILIRPVDVKAIEPQEQTKTTVSRGGKD